MSHHSMEPRGARDFSSPQVRIRGANDFRQYSNQRLRLPNERPPLGPRVRRTMGALLTLAVVGGIGVGVYFGVTLLVEDDDETATEAVETVEAVEEEAAEDVVTETVESGQDGTSGPGAAQAQAEASAAEQESTSDASGSAEVEQSEPPATEQQATQTQASSVAISSIQPTVAVQQVTSAQLNGAEVVAERATAEPVPSGIPRMLADGADYDATEPATVFTSRWPVGTSLRLTRLPGATVLTEEQQAEVVGLAALVVVRGTESSNTDLQLSPAAFDQIAFYGTERIIAVRVEVTAPPPE